MQILGFNITRTKSLQQIGPVGTWWPIIRESFAGAWQQNVEITVQDSLRYWAVFRCVSMIASDVAKMDLNLWEQTADDIWQKVKGDSPFKHVIAKPNEYQNTMQFIESWQQSKLSRGNTYVLKERDRRGGDGAGVVRALYVLDPLRTFPLVSDVTGEVFYQLATDNLAGIGEQVTVPASEIIHDRINTFYHPLCGLSPLYAAGLSALMGSNIQQNSAQFFSNAARPSGILMAPGAIKQQHADEIKAYWNTQFKADNTGRVALLGDGMKFEAITMTATDAQLVDQLKWTDAMIAGAFGVPAYMINAGTAPAYNNVEALGQQYFSQCIQVHVEAIQRCLTEGLGLDQVTGKTYGARFELSDLLKMDTATLVTSHKNAVGGGIETINEARKALNLPRKPGLDMPMMQFQNWPADVLAGREAADLSPSAPFPSQQGGGDGSAKPGEQTPSGGDTADAAKMAALMLHKHLADAPAAYRVFR